MSINLNQIYLDKVREFTTSTQSKRFDEDFAVAVNQALDELNVAGDLDSPIDHIDTHDAVIDDLDAKHSGILRSGLTYFLLILGQQKAGRADHIGIAQAQWTEAKRDFMVLMQREDQATVDSDDNPSNDIIGLGYKTET